MPKSERIELRVTVEEKAQIGRSAEQVGVGLSEFIRRQLLGDPDATSAPPARPPADATPTSPATPSPEQSPPATDDDLEARIAARAKVLERRMGKRAAWATARRELA